MAIRKASPLSRPFLLLITAAVLISGFLLTAATPIAAGPQREVFTTLRCTINGTSTLTWEGRHVGSFTLNWYDGFGDVTLQTSANGGRGSSGSMTMPTPANSTEFVVHALTERGRDLGASGVFCTE